MGMRSTVEESDLNGNIEIVEKWLLAKKLIGDYGERPYIYNSIILGDVSELGGHGNIHLEWDDWKVHGYWYDELCDLLFDLAELGVEGTESFTYEDGQNYKIILKDKKVYCEFGPNLDWDDENEKYVAVEGSDSELCELKKGPKTTLGSYEWHLTQEDIENA